jgi:thiamine-phosphate pyrophosphorylase
VGPVVAGAVRGGGRVVQVRAKSLPDGVLLALARDAVAAARAEGGLLLVNDRPDIALLAAADGVHLGQDDLPSDEARRQAGAGMLIGLSTHAPAEVAAAWGSEADYIGVGPVHATPTKPGRPPVGLDLVRFAARPPELAARPPELAEPLPFFAIGGIDASTLPDVLAAGASRVCVLRALTESEDPAATARQLRAMLVAACAGAEAGRP